MRTEDIVDGVRVAGRFASYQHAMDAVLATVETLGHCSEVVSSRLIEDLPSELTRLMPTEVASFPLSAFYREVGRREGRGCSTSEVRRHARTVLTVLHVAGGWSFSPASAGLPAEYDDLVEPKHLSQPSRSRPRSAGAFVPGPRRPDHDVL